MYASRDDHIVPWRAGYRTTALVGGDVTFVLGASGHIAGVINPPEPKRRSYWTNELVTDSPDDWLARASAAAGKLVAALVDVAGEARGRASRGAARPPATLDTLRSNPPRAAMCERRPERHRMPGGPTAGCTLR